MNKLRPTRPLAFLLVLVIVFVPGIAVTAALAANQLGYCVNAILPDSEGLNAQPYLLQVDADSAQIRLRRTVAREATLTVKAEGLESIVQTAGAGEIQTFDVRGLTPGTDYDYTVQRADTTWEGSFRTPSGPQDTVRLNVLGSSGVSNDVQHDIADEMLADEPDLILHTGDVVFPRGALCHYGLRYFGPYEELLPDVPVAAAIGEVDRKAGNGSAFRETFAADPERDGAEPGYRAFHYGPVHVVLLDSELYASNDAAAIERQRGWLTQELEASDASWTVVVLHRPPFSSTDGAASAEIREDLVAIFVEHGVDLVLSGHARNYERFQPEGDVTYVVSGGGGANTQEFDTNRTSVAAADVHHFLSIQADPSALSVRVIDRNGATIDSFTLDN